jgi:hypothetical protein
MNGPLALGDEAAAPLFTFEKVRRDRVRGLERQGFRAPLEVP